MAADEPRKRRVSLRGRFDGSRDGPCSESNNGWPFRLPLSLSLSSPLCLRPFPDLWIRANQRLINFSNRTKITRFAFAKYRFPYRSPSPSLSLVLVEQKRRNERERKKIFNFTPLFLGKIHFRHRSIDG